MATQSHSQRIGSIGHKWALTEIASHPGWLSRDLPEDYGVDAEAEITEPAVVGEILKLQFKSSESVHINDEGVRLLIDKRYVDYAKSCRYPVIFVAIDVQAKQAWYLWLQDWMLKLRADHESLDPNQSSYTVRVSADKTLASGLAGPLKEIARWRGETQLVLSLLDAMRTAITVKDETIVDSIIELIVHAAPAMADATLDVVIEEAILLGDRMRGTSEGLKISRVLFALIREFGRNTSVQIVDAMVRREDGWSRAGLTGLEILYDDHFKHTSALGLVKHFIQLGSRHIAYYCALREANPTKGGLEVALSPIDFQFQGLFFRAPQHTSFMNSYANRGPSAILDRLDEAGE